MCKTTQLTKGKRMLASHHQVKTNGGGGGGLGLSESHSAAYGIVSHFLPLILASTFETATSSNDPHTSNL